MNRIVATPNDHGCAGLGLRALVASTHGDVVDDFAKVLGTACRVHETRVNAEIVHARFIVGTVFVFETFSLLAGNKSITKRPSWTFTMIIVVAFRSAHSHHTTRIRIARIGLLNTLLIFATITGGTIWVNHTFRSTASDGVRLRDESTQAFTNWKSSRIGLARSAWPTRSGITRVRFFHASLVFAHVVRSESVITIDIDSTFRSTAFNCIGHWNKTRKTLANGIFVMIHLARGSHPARTRIARIWSFNTLVVLTDKPDWTIIINHTLRSTTSHSIGLGNEALLALTNCIPLGPFETVSTGTAGRGMARISSGNTFVVHTNGARLMIAFGIFGAFVSTASYCIRFGHKSGLAVTHGATQMIGCASCTGSTWRGIAWIGLRHTFVALTNISPGAIVVSVTLWTTPGDGIGLGNESVLALANGITISIVPTCGTWTTRRWIARIGFRNTFLRSTY